MVDGSDVSSGSAGRAALDEQSRQLEQFVVLANAVSSSASGLLSWSSKFCAIGAYLFLESCSRRVRPSLSEAIRTRGFVS